MFSLVREKMYYWTPAGRLKLLFGVIQLIGLKPDPTDDLNLGLVDPN